MRSLAPLLILLVAALPVSADTGPWKMESLRKPPKWTVETKGPVSTIYYEGEPYLGKPTRVWAYLAVPDKPKGKLPAMVLVHGGGGTAFQEWAELWRKRGYVALAMDLAGAGPGRKRLADGGPNQSDKEKFFFEGKIEDFWTYHAVADVIRGVSLVESLPEVDKDRIGITGISWGGYLTSIVSGLDDRLKVAVPVYGCGFIHENSAWNAIFAMLKPEQRKRWIENFEPSRYLGQAKMPVLWVNGTNDFAYPLDSYQKSYRKTPNHALCVTIRLPHSHPAGWAPVEIGLFVDQYLKKGKPLAKNLSAKREGTTVEVKFKAEVQVKSAALCYTSDTGPWQKRNWKSLPAKIEGDSVKVELPKDRPLVYFVTLTDDRKATISTEHETLKKE